MRRSIDCVNHTDKAQFSCRKLSIPTRKKSGNLFHALAFYQISREIFPLFPVDTRDGVVTLETGIERYWIYGVIELSVEKSPSSSKAWLHIEKISAENIL